MKQFFVKHDKLILCILSIALSLISFAVAEFFLLSNDCTFKGRDLFLMLGGASLMLFSCLAVESIYYFDNYHKDQKSSAADQEDIK